MNQEGVDQVLRETQKRRSTSSAALLWRKHKRTTERSAFESDQTNPTNRKWWMPSTSRHVRPCMHDTLQLGRVSAWTPLLAHVHYFIFHAFFRDAKYKYKNNKILSHHSPHSLSSLYTTILPVSWPLFSTKLPRIPLLFTYKFATTSPVLLAPIISNKLRGSAKHRHEG